MLKYYNIHSFLFHKDRACNQVGKRFLQSSLYFNQGIFLRITQHHYPSVLSPSPLPHTFVSDGLLKPDPPSSPIHTKSSLAACLPLLLMPPTSIPSPSFVNGNPQPSLTPWAGGLTRSSLRPVAKSLSPKAHCYHQW